MSGPYETESQADAAVQHIYDSPPGTGAWGTGNHKLLEDACGAAGVTLGAYDHRILLWLANWEPATCAVVAGLITRAHRGALDGGQPGTVLEALGLAAEYKRDLAETCPDCADQSCGTCGWRLARASEFDALAETIRRQP
jgi:hypothetical protein